MMRHFYLYLIKEEFANHFFGREFKIFRLFQDYIWTSSDHHVYPVLKQQVEYVTKTIPVIYLDEWMKTFLSKREDYQYVTPIHKIYLSKKRGNATLLLKDRYIEITSSGSYEAETVFFEILRKFDTCFLAIDFQNEQYGWLNPIKKRNFV
ncbi:sporulation inhibitor of replication protein SirA [Bacillus alveayuensis]|uniref:sporulation inhibitor of replication protein SirA n=1 Tax=Aeribacillus alveayuensis TaxID=279215 RepID=UPI0005CDC7DF|nr:sporulation inhibitor of replication protein SirA [Bacillus alveayuensis]